MPMRPRLSGPSPMCSLLKKKIRLPWPGTPQVEKHVNGRYARRVESSPNRYTQDCVAQFSEYWTSRSPVPAGFDLHRNQALALTSATYNGLFLTTWLLMLGMMLPGTDVRSVICKLAATQFILQPLVYVPFFFLFHGFLVGERLSESLDRMRSEYLFLLLRLWSIFMPGRLLMFMIVPVRYQVLWDSSVSFAWQILLSIFCVGHGHHQVGSSFSDMIVQHTLYPVSFVDFGHLRSSASSVSRTGLSPGK